MSPQICVGAFATVFFALGALMVLRAKYRGLRLIAILPAGCALVVGVWTVWNVVATRHGGGVARLFAAKASEVRAIRLESSRDPGPPPLVPSTVRVTDRRTIAEVLAALRTATPCSPNHPNGLWSVVLGVEDAHGVAYGVVDRTDNQGVQVTVFSDRTTGWVLGQRCDDALGPVLLRIAASTGSAR